MAEPIYVNRTRLVSSLDNSLVQPFNDLSKQTRIPKSRLLDEAVEDLLKNMRRSRGEGKISPPTS